MYPAPSFLYSVCGQCPLMWMAMRQYLPFVPAVFFKVLAATLTLVLIGFVVAFLVFGEITTTDIVGSLISAPIFAYLVHLWLTLGKDW